MTAAGSRYRASYLFRFLLAPEPVRPHIGAARMPGFDLDDREALALTLYLTTLQRDAPAPTLNEDGGVDAATLVRDELGCLVCHALDGTGGISAPPLDEVGARVTEDFLVRYLANPTVFDSTNVMPPLFFERTGTDWRPRVDDAASKLQAVVRYLSRPGRSERSDAERRFDAARREHGEVTAAMGAEIARALNCGGCHRGLPAAREPIAPDLAHAVQRALPEWLRSYLRRPIPIRPAGYHPGDGSRMPDFRLTESEADSIAAYLISTAPNAVEETPEALTPFQRSKAKAFLVDRLPCLGCHRLNGDGGRIGPDLSGVGTRLTASAIRMIVADPRQGAPGSIMPRHPMPDDRVDLIAAFLAEQTAVDTTSAYVSLVDWPPGSRQPDSESGEEIYRAYCAHCHGTEGRGDGWNSSFLPVPPTPHADSAYMARRPDDTLYDGIHAGGYILNRSHRMPAFGQRLTDGQIRALVAYMRNLCNCQGPPWSRDGRRN